MLSSLPLNVITFSRQEGSLTENQRSSIRTPANRIPSTDVIVPLKYNDTDAKVRLISCRRYGHLSTR